MIPTAELLTAGENCLRNGYYARSWRARRLRSSQMVAEALRIVLTAKTSEKPFGEMAGDSVVQLAADRGLESTASSSYPAVINHACIADLIATSLRKPTDPPWLVPESVQNWTSGAFLSPDGSHLRRILIVSHWTAERLESERRGWMTVGEMAHYDLPMQLVVCVIGHANLLGKRSGPWSQALLHPKNCMIKFRKISHGQGRRSGGAEFKDTWAKIYREDRAEISREKWLQQMLTDGVLQDHLMRVDIPVLESRQARRIRALCERKLARLYAMKRKPEMNLSTCWWPTPCSFLRCCWHPTPREPSERTGYIPILSGGMAYQTKSIDPSP